MPDENTNFYAIDSLTKAILELTCRQKIYEQIILELVNHTSLDVRNACAESAKRAAETMVDNNASLVDADGDMYITSVLNEFYRGIGIKMR